MVAPAALATTLNHLSPWIERKPKNFGLDRYAVMLQLFVYLELALKARYRTKVYGKIPDLDHAFGRFIRGADDEDEPSDSIKKIRQFMQRRLKECVAASTDVIGEITRRNKRKRKR